MLRVRRDVNQSECVNLPMAWLNGGTYVYQYMGHCWEGRIEDMTPVMLEGIAGYCWLPSNAVEGRILTRRLIPRDRPGPTRWAG